jgi:hypothetical protein
MKSMDFERCSTSGRDPRISISENGRTFRMNNPNRRWVARVQVDGCLISGEQERCDYLLEIDDPCQRAIYLELKGANIRKAYAQLVATINQPQLMERHKHSERICHIVASRVPRANPRVQQMKAQMLKDYKVQLFVHTTEVTTKC